MPRKSAPPKSPRPESSRLGREDWLDAAFEAVVEGGFDKVRVLVLADRLGVTRGSFYWHFADHAELIKALLERWRQQEAALNAELRAASTDDAQADLDRLLDAALAHAGPDFENMRFELALRGLGRRDAEVAQLLVTVDESRMELFAEQFSRLVAEPQAARDMAVLFYLALVGSYQALSRPGTTPLIKQYLQGIIAQYLIRGRVPAIRPTLSPAAAQAA